MWHDQILSDDVLMAGVDKYALRTVKIILPVLADITSIPPTTAVLSEMLLLTWNFDPTREIVFEFQASGEIVMGVCLHTGKRITFEAATLTEMLKVCNSLFRALIDYGTSGCLKPSRSSSITPTSS